MAIIQDWKITSRGTHCAHTETPFEDGDKFFTCIFDDPESDGFIRRDFLAASWKEIEPTLKVRPFSFWKSTFKVPVVVEKNEVLEKNSAEGMLRKMVEADEPRTENARFILALMLERKKTLIPTAEKMTDERKLLLYEHKETGEVFIVVDPQLRLSEIESVQLEVADLLAGRIPAGAEDD
ncbi:MAG: hypothetical protein ACKVJU_19815, partial [Verrucomicrobiales bacterium]